MSNIRTPLNYGWSWRHNGVCYRKITDGPAVAITKFESAFGLLKVTTATAHGLASGEYTEITNTTNYNGIWSIYDIPDSTSFRINRSFVADDATGYSNRIGATMGVPTDSAQSGDVLNYTDQTWTYDDDYVTNGPTHRTWTACQMCVANLPDHYFYARGGGAWTQFFTVPYNGVARVWDDYNSSGNPRYIRINGTTTVSWGYQYGNAVPIRLIAGDSLEYWLWPGNPYSTPTDLNFIFLPYIWPQP